ncbi:MAG: hypothetical protein Kow0059_14500 [Candidatus Sumerlaeia bacterium]
MVITKEQESELKQLAAMDLPALERMIAPHVLSAARQRELFEKFVERMEARRRSVEARNFAEACASITDSESLAGEIMHKLIEDPVREWAEKWAPRYSRCICEELNYRRRRLFGEFPSQGYDICKIVLEQILDEGGEQPPFSLPLLVAYLIQSRILDDVCEVKFQLPVRDIAERYNFSLPTIYEWMRRGHIRGKKQGRRVIIDVPSLERFLQQKGYLTTTKD